jgi:hypothetical protein
MSLWACAHPETHFTEGHQTFLVGGRIQPTQPQRQIKDSRATQLGSILSKKGGENGKENHFSY